VDDTTPTGDPNTAALLTLGLVLYASLIFVGIALAIYYVRRNQKARAITAATAVGVLTVAGLVAAIASSVI
jgi:ABC-type Fe3+ transport system permease subunit